MITGTSMEILNCQIPGHDLEDSQYWKRNRQTGVRGPEGDWQESKRLQDQKSCVAGTGNTCQMHPNVRKSKNGPSKNRNFITPEAYVQFTSFNRRMRNSKTSWETLAGSWKFQCQRQCLIRLQKSAVVKLTAALGNARQKMLVLSKLTSLREFDWKEFFMGIMNIILQPRD